MHVFWTWDTQKDSDEFYSMMKKYLNSKYHETMIENEEGLCWNSKHQASCLYQSGLDTLWVTAPDIQIINQILTLTAGFIQ